eukprot:1273959-Prymnesium_polylepis.1
MPRPGLDRRLLLVGVVGELDGEVEPAAADTAHLDLPPELAELLVHRLALERLRQLRFVAHALRLPRIVELERRRIL